MGLEVATFISQLVATNPVGGTDNYSTADDHLRLIKSVLQSQFPNFNAAAVNLTPAELNLLDGLTASAAEINTLDGFTGNTADLNILSGQDTGGLTNAELAFVKGVTSDIQAQFDALVIGSDVQAWDAQLDDIAALAITDGNFIVANGAAWVAESGATARASMGAIADGDSIGDLTFTNHIDIVSSAVRLARSVSNELTVAGKAVIRHEDGTFVDSGLTVSTSAPSGGGNGDLWFEYEL